jgi:hypothetical protein
MEQIEQNRELFPAVDMRAGLKPLIPYDPARYFPPRVSYAESLRRSAEEEASKEGK